MTLAPLARCHTLTLPAGQAHLLQVAAGTRLHLQRGRLVLTAASGWLADTGVQIAWPLRQGEVHQVEQSGWLRLQAGAELAELRCHAAAALPARERWREALAVARHWARRLARHVTPTSAPGTL